MSSLLVIVGGLAFAIVSLLVLRAAPRMTAVLWLLVVFFVPVWMGVFVGPFWSAISLFTVLAIATCSRSVELTPVDALIGAFTLLVLAQFAIGITSLSASFTALTQWLLPYAWGRLVLTRVELTALVRAISVIAAVAAAMAIVESLTSTNLFLLIPPSNYGLYSGWSSLQPRGGLLRVEGAFGHSIALGATLSMCAAFVLAARWRLYIRVLLLATLAGAVVLTLSRIGLVTFAATVMLTILVLPGLSRATRVLTVLVGLGATIIVVPFVGGVFLEAGQEASGSADYRLGLLSLVQVLRPFGAAPDIAGVTVGGEYLGFFARSTDNAFMSIAMRVGWVPTLILVGALVLSAISIMRRERANAASVAVAGQIPGLFAVAFITQYAVFFWFTVGLAATLGAGASAQTAVVSRRGMEFDEYIGAVTR